MASCTIVGRQFNQRGLNCNRESLVGKPLEDVQKFHNSHEFFAMCGVGGVEWNGVGVLQWISFLHSTLIHGNKGGFNWGQTLIERKSRIFCPDLCVLFVRTVAHTKLKQRGLFVVLSQRPKNCLAFSSPDFTQLSLRLYFGL